MEIRPPCVTVISLRSTDPGPHQTEFGRGYGRSNQRSADGAFGNTGGVLGDGKQDLWVIKAAGTPEGFSYPGGQSGDSSEARQSDQVGDDQKCQCPDHHIDFFSKAIRHFARLVAALSLQMGRPRTIQRREVSSCATRFLRSRVLGL
jgi:hypothetical protein